MKYVRTKIEEMQGYVPGEQPKDGEAVKLNTNENPYRASEKVYDAIRAVAEKGLSRYPNPLGQSFREAAAQVLGVDPDWILCGNGSDDILTVLTRTFVGDGERLRLPYPSYILYRSLAEIQGAWSDEVFFNDDWSLPENFGDASFIGTAGGSKQSLPDSLKQVLTNESSISNDLSEHFLTKNISTNDILAEKSLSQTAKKIAGQMLAPLPRLGLVYLPNPNSPSGTLLPKEDLALFAEMLPCPLVIDEAYADFAGINCIDLVKRNPKIMISRTLSKAYALAGLRFGFLIAQPCMINQLLKVKDSYNCDALSIAAATAAIQDQEWREENCRKILSTRACLTERMRDLGFTVPDSFANFTWNTHLDEKVNLKTIYEYVKQRGYLMRYMEYPNWGTGLRISVGTDDQTNRCIDLIAEALHR